MNNPSYSAGYYQSIKEDSVASAREVVPLIMKLLAPRHVVDVGCGSGAWAAAYKQAGAAGLGVDGQDVRVEQLLIPPPEIERRDLTEPFRLHRPVRLVKCLGVA